MDLERLKSNLKYAIPLELYQIEADRVTLFISKNGISQRTSMIVADMFRYFRRLYKDNNVTLSFFPTDNEALIDKIAARLHQEDGTPDKVVIGTWDTIAGFASQFFGEDINKIMERVPILGGALFHLSISADNLPVVVVLDPDKNYVKKSPDDSEEKYDSPLEVLTAKPEPGSKEEKAQIKKEEDKLYALLRECYVLDIELDIDNVKKRFNEAINSDINYQLVIKDGFHKDGIRYLCDYCDIYVAEGKEYKLNLTAVEKAVYLTFLLYPQGIRVKETFWGFRETCMKIYGQLPMDERFETDSGFRLDSNPLPEVYEDTLRGYLSTIRAKVAKKVANPKTAIEFAIEGYKDQEFGIARSTPELIAKIKEDFRL